MDKIIEKVFQHPYAPYAVLGVIVLCVVLTVVKGHSTFVQLVKQGAKLEIAEARSKGYKITEILDVVHAKAIERVKLSKSKFVQLYVFILSNKRISNLVKKMATKIIQKIMDEEETDANTTSEK